jgi:mannose-6-phosphate isomerase-like protein (cupin superfamily)
MLLGAALCDSDVPSRQQCDPEGGEKSGADGVEDLRAVRLSDWGGMTRYRHSFPDTPRTSPSSDLRKRTLELESKRLSVVEYSTEMTPHWCDRGHLGYLVSGQLRIEFDKGDIVNYYPGDSILIPSGAEHRHVAYVIRGPVRVVYAEGVT